MWNVHSYMRVKAAAIFCQQYGCRPFQTADLHPEPEARHRLAVAPLQEVLQVVTEEGHVGRRLHWEHERENGDVFTSHRAKKEKPPRQNTLAKYWKVQF